MRTSANTITLGLMAKYWDVGQVKTRLGTTIGMPRAARLHRLFVLHLCRSLSPVAGRRIVCLAPETRREPFLSELGFHQLDQFWETMRQAEGSLGNRMLDWFDTVFRDPQWPASHAILIGADCPTLSAAQIEEANHRLDSHDVAIGPATDGGYYLIGLSAPWTVARFRTIFDDVPWSTDQVLRITQERIAAAGLSCYQLQEREDIDTIADLNRLRKQLAARTATDTGDETSKRPIDLGTAIENILQDESASFEVGGSQP